MTKEWTPSDRADEIDDQYERDWWRRVRDIADAPDVDEPLLPAVLEIANEALAELGEPETGGSAGGDPRAARQLRAAD